MGRVEGKVPLISGGARGLGAAIALRLVEEGAKVVIGDLLEKDGNELAAASGGAITFTPLDVTDPAQWEAAVGVAASRYGRLDVLVNSAGIATFGPIDEYTIEAWDTIIRINLSGAFYGIKAAIPELKKSGNASIVNISSIAGLQGLEAAPGYNASKFGMRGLTKNAALDLARYGIRSNSVHPGTIRTPMTEKFVLPQSHVALHRLGEAIEIANLVLFLASDESTFSTGSEFVADGGETAGLAHYDD